MCYSHTYLNDHCHNIRQRTYPKERLNKTTELNHRDFLIRMLLQRLLLTLLITDHCTCTICWLSLGFVYFYPYVMSCVWQLQNKRKYDDDDCHICMHFLLNFPLVAAWHINCETIKFGLFNLQLCTIECIIWCTNLYPYMSLYNYFSLTHCVIMYTRPQSPPRHLR